MFDGKMKLFWALWTWGEMFVVTLLGLCVMTVVWAATVPFDRRRYIIGRTFRLVAVVIAKLTPIWRFEVTGSLPEPRPGRTVCVSNHCSTADPFLLSHLPWEMKWLSKTANFKLPVIGWMMRMAGDVEVVRGERESAKRAMAACAEWLERGMPVMIFPEGTRSRDGDMLPFKDGAFRLAIETGAEVLPMAVAGTHTAMKKGDWKPQYSHALVTVGQPIDTTEMTLDDVDRLKAMARERIAELRDQIGDLHTARMGARSAA